MHPSFASLAITGILIFVAIVMTIMNFNALKIYETIMILFLMAISIGIHGIQHFNEDLFYDYNPLHGQLLPKDMLKPH